MKTKKTGRFRLLVQALSTLAVNSHLTGLFTGFLYQGKAKTVCVPVLNCYSCPLASVSCPIGALQAVAAGVRNQVSWYVVGMLGVVGALAGRITCGWACPFGFLQDTLYRIKSRKFGLPRPLTWLKYPVLIIMVLLLPALLVDPDGQGSVWFCKLLCPAGTLEAGIPALLTTGSLWQMVGLLFFIKALFLALFLALMVFVKRPFCRIACPLGAFLGPFNRVSMLRMSVAEAKCARCNECARVCPVDIKVYENPDSPECVRCLECIKQCPSRAVSFGAKTSVPAPERPADSTSSPSKEAA